ncbi:hypothetical protein FG170_17935 [Serratia marcescens]|nr:hypothetical protein FG170_17935 [Serratia marcescens]
MSRTIMLIPTGTSVGLTSVSLGVIRSMEQKRRSSERVQAYRSTAHRRQRARPDHHHHPQQQLHHYGGRTAAHGLR